MTKKVLFFSSLPFLYLLIMLFKIDGSLMVDLGRQLKMGEVIYTCQCIPQTNLFSSIYADFPAVNHSWLSQVVFYLFAHTFGLTSLLYLKVILVFLSFLLIYSTAFRKEQLFASVMFGLLGVSLFAERFLVRPELFSYFFIALIITLLELYKKKQKLFVLWFIPMIIALWVNMHIYFFIGVLLFLYFVVEQFILTKRVRPGFVSLIPAVLLAPLLNPAFIQGAIYPFMIFSNYGAGVMENFPPLLLISGNYPLTAEVFSIVIFELLSVIALAGVLIVPKRKFVFEKLSTLLGIILGQVLNRCISLFTFLGMPFLVKEYAYIERHVEPKLRKRVMTGVKTFLIVLFASMVVIHIRDVVTYPLYGFYFGNPYESGVKFFQENNLKGPMFNNGTLGNYLIYKLYPEEKVFVDGRPEAYPPSFMKAYEHMLQDYTYFTQEAEKHSINVVFQGMLDYPTLTRPFLLRMANDPRWAPVFWDGTVAIFVRNTLENEPIISQNKQVRNNLLKALGSE